MENKQLIKCACGCGRTLSRFDKKGRERKRIQYHHKNQLKKQENILCACGCGKYRFKYDKNWEIRKYIGGHNNRKYIKIQKKVLCKCGCGTMINKYNKNWREIKYVYGHARRGKKLGRKQIIKDPKTLGEIRSRNKREWWINPNNLKKIQVVKTNIGKANKISLKGKVIPKLVKEKIRKKLIGIRRSEETIKKMIGDKNPAWLGGKSFEPYTKEFNDMLKRAIRKRDNQVCMNCAIHREKLNRALHVHHIDYDKNLSLPQNLISLCVSCHGLTNKNRPYWEKLFQEKLAKLYGYKYINEEIVLEVKNCNK